MSAVLSRKARNLMGAWKAGFIAGFSLFPESLCPYLDKKQGNGNVTFSRAFLRFWVDGWCEGQKARYDYDASLMKSLQGHLFEDAPPERPEETGAVVRKAADHAPEI